MKIKALLYCTKAKPYLTRNDLPDEKGEFYKHWQLGGELDKKHLYGDIPILNGKIVAECDYEVDEIELLGDEINLYYGIENKACLTTEQIENYLGYDNDYKGYAIHIKNLNIFDKPRELCDYSRRLPSGDFQVLGNAPQNMMKCCEIKYIIEDYILISIRPEWLCKILNGEKKTIEVRKKVLKEMIK